MEHCNFIFMHINRKMIAHYKGSGPELYVIRESVSKYLVSSSLFITFELIDKHPPPQGVRTAGIA